MSRGRIATDRKKKARNGGSYKGDVRSALHSLKHLMQSLLSGRRLSGRQVEKPATLT